MAAEVSFSARLKDERSNLQRPQPGSRGGVPSRPTSRPHSQRPQVSVAENPATPQPPLNSKEIKADLDRFYAEKAVVRAAAERDAEYTAVFSELGLAGADIERVKSNRTELHRMAIAAGEPLEALIQARNKYDSDMQSLLGSENYQRYRSYEERKPAVREYEMLTQYGLTNYNLAIEATAADTIVSIIKNARATTTETWDGPYDPFPRPAIGRQMVLDRFTEHIRDLRDNSKLALTMAQEAGLPESYSQLLSDYYAEKLTSLETSRERVSLPPEERKRALIKEMQEQTKRRTLDERSRRP